MIPLLKSLEVSFLLWVSSWHQIFVEHPVVGEDLALQVEADARVGEVGHHHDYRVYPRRRWGELIGELIPLVVNVWVQVETLGGKGFIPEDLLVRVYPAGH